MNIDIFDYNLPEELIAQTPVEPRNSSRLLKVDRQTGEIIQNNASAIAVMVRAVSDKSPEYTLQSIYDRAPAKIE